MRAVTPHVQRKDKNHTTRNLVTFLFVCKLNKMTRILINIRTRCFIAEITYRQEYELTISHKQNEKFLIKSREMSV